MVSERVSRLVTGMAEAELPIVAVIAPALLFPSPTRVLVVPLVLLVWFCNRRVHGHWIPATPLNAPLLLLLGMVAVSLAATFDVGFSLGKVSGVVLGAFVFWAVTRWVTTAPRLRAALAVFLGAAGGLAIIGLLGTNWFDKFPLFDVIIKRLPPAIRGIPGAEEGFHANAVAGCLVLFVPLQVALLVGGPQGWLRHRQPRGRGTLWEAERLIQGLLVALTVGTLLLTQSRGAWLGLLVATVAFLCWHTRRTRAVAAALIGTAGIIALMLGPGRMYNFVTSGTGPGMAGNISGRLALWSSAVRGIQDFPFTGMGMNAFRRVLPVLYPTFISPDLDLAHAHNHLLQAGLDLGIPGLVAYTSIWIVTGILLVMVRRRPAERLHRTVAGGLAAGLIAHFVFSMTDVIPLGAKVGVLFWLTVALAVALHRVTLAATEADSEQAARDPQTT